MMSKPRQSGLPTPHRPTGMATPRSRSNSSAIHNIEQVNPDAEFMSKAFADAIAKNDPSKHKTSRASDISNASLSPLTASYSGSSISGRSSVASSSSALSSSYHPRNVPERSKTPTSTRPPSRHSDVFHNRSSSRAGRAFEVGDSVRIESLGFEGTLRYLGEIDGKSGLWAGVELGGGFAGKGKNNGSAAGKIYFSCPDKCGVFVATTKLSAPTVRPSSVASSRGGGRNTPAFSGRATPSTYGRPSTISNGRITPAGRTTPSVPETPAVRAARARAMTAKAGVTPTASSKTNKLSDKITSGSRASKYVSMTAKQLSTINRTDSENIVGNSSPTRIGRTVSSPVRPTGSPFTTPKPRLPLNSGITPKPRIPSSVAMPPPPSPGLRSHDSANSAISYQDLEQQGKAIQEKIAALSASTVSTTYGINTSPRRSHSSASMRSNDDRHVDQLLSRIEALEYDNARLREAPPLPPSSPAADSDLLQKLENISQSYEAAQKKISDLESSLNSAESSLSSRDSQIQTLKSEHEESLKSLSNSHASQKEALSGLDAKLARATEEINALTGRLEDSEALVKSLKDVIEETSVRHEEEDKTLEVERAEWSIVEARFKKIHAELEEDKKELVSQVDELRQAGQETIALYEERLRASDVKRYELEDRIVELQAVSPTVKSPRISSNGMSATAQIDNETLRDQVVHFQQKISNLEDMIEDSKIAAEREESQIRERLRRAKEKEDSLKKEAADSRKEIERLTKSEEGARHRVEEIEEALRESTVALENARAEIETLRGDLDNLNGIVASTSANSDHFETMKSFESQNSSLKRKVEEYEAQLAQSQQELENLKKRKNRDVPVNGSTQITPSKHELSNAREEIKGLKHIVQELQMECSALEQQNQVKESENRLLQNEMEQLKQEIKILEDNIDQSILQAERNDDDIPHSSDDSDVETLRRMLKDQKTKFESDIEQLRKRVSDADMKIARTTHDLNKEISELEALVESKIYREDELEQEIERLKDKLSRQKKSSKGPTETTESYQRGRTISTASTTTSIASDDTSSELVCEICERSGHDIFNCDLLKDDPMPITKGGNIKAEAKLFCEECEGYGHTASDCPHSSDVF